MKVPAIKAYSMGNHFFAAEILSLTFKIFVLINNGEDIVNLNQSILSGYGNTTNILTPGLGSSGM